MLIIAESRHFFENPSPIEEPLRAARIMNGKEYGMLLHREIHRLLLCLSLVLASSHAQAMSHVDLLETAAYHDDARVQLPPCHQHMLDADSKKGGQHKGGCCSSFACCLGLLSESAVPERVVAILTHDSVRERTMYSTIFRPLFPPPKPV
jgi:hypothetical protein